MPPADRAVFRLPGSALFLPVMAFLFTAPLASASVWTVGFFLIPVYALFYVFWTKTVADAETITVNMPFGRRVIPWTQLNGFEFHGPRWAIAVTLDGQRVRLPMVRPRDLARLAAVSGGRLSFGERTLAEAENATDSTTTLIDGEGELIDPDRVDPDVAAETPPTSHDAEGTDRAAAAE